ncbi:hypothetical protein C8J56DRAFT_484170 [Mycena floridula]|nr:hypothetical protein C8J56DRAFT_484170 [Mycena floridula]
MLPPRLQLSTILRRGLSTSPPVICIRPIRKPIVGKKEAIQLHLLPRPEGATEEWFTPFPSKIDQEWSEKHGPTADFDPACHSNEFTKVGPGVFLRFSNRRAAHAVGILIAEFTDSDDLSNYNRIDAEAQGYILFDWRSLEPYPQSPPISATDKPTYVVALRVEKILVLTPDNDHLILTLPNWESMNSHSYRIRNGMINLRLRSAETKRRGN